MSQHDSLFFFGVGGEALVVNCFRDQADYLPVGNQAEFLPGMVAILYNVIGSFELEITLLESILFILGYNNALVWGEFFAVKTQFLSEEEVGV